MLGGYRRYLSNACDTLLQGRDLKRPATARVRAVLGHALSFNTWRSFAIEQRLADKASAELMCLLVTAANA
jgi:hypothetical protein